MRCSASIFHELSERLADDRSDERLALLLRGHRLDESHELIRASLQQRLRQQILSRDALDRSAKGLYLQLALEEEGSIPDDVLEKLTLQECNLSQISPEQLVKLSHQLGQSDRPADGARLAAFAAKEFATDGKARESEDAFLKAFCLDRLNQEAAEGVAQAISSARRRCEALEAECQALRQHVPGVVWDVSDYDFPDVSDYDFPAWRQLPCLRSESFHLLSSGVKGQIELVGKERGIFVGLVVDSCALLVEWSLQFGSGAVENSSCDFSSCAANPEGLRQSRCGTLMPPGTESITLRILSVQQRGSRLRFT